MSPAAVAWLTDERAGASNPRPVVPAPHMCRKCGGPVSDMEAIASGLLGPLDRKCLAATLHTIRRDAAGYAAHFSNGSNLGGA